MSFPAGIFKREEGGQVLVLAAMAMTALLGMSAFVIDVASWYQLQRRTQAAADAGALAAAQYLPSNASTAVSTAQTYVGKNIAGATATITTPYNSDTSKIHVTVTATAPTFFAKIFGINSVTVSSDSTAAGTKGAVGTGYWVAPMAVSGSCGGDGTQPCVGTYNGYNYIAYHHLGSCTGSTYSFCFTNLTSASAWKESAANDATLRGWILGGYPSPLSIGANTGDYQTTDCSSPCTYTGGNECGHNATPASCTLAAALVSMAGKIILVPVFDPTKTKSLNHFYIRGFAAFQIASTNVFQNTVDPAHWWITGKYLGNYTCLNPGQGNGTPAGYGSNCYGTPQSPPASGSDYGAEGGAIQLTE